LYLHEDVIDKAKEYNVKFARLQFTDIFGVLKNIAVTVDDLKRALDGQLIFDSSVLEGVIKNRERDIILKPDPSTFVVFPWRPREGAVARLICDIINPDGTPFPGCPRHVLHKVLTEASAAGFSAMVGIEVEFYLFHGDDKGNPTTNTHDRAGFCDLSPIDLGENARRDMVLTLEEMGIEIGSSHHELGNGQHEIVLKYDEAKTAADKFITAKFVVRTIAQRHGLHASFMPKPIINMPGSAMHCHISLYCHGRNAFFDPESPRQLSSDCTYFIGGMLNHAKANTAITNPLINSYKRLIPSELVPVYIAWSEHIRNSVIRIPAYRGQQTRVEVRNPDPSCNPYLALAVIIKAGLEGIKTLSLPPDPILENIHQMEENQKKALQVGRLPHHLEAALTELAQDKVIRSALGEYLFNRFYQGKLQEWERYHNQVHPWELKEYLTVY